MTDRGNIEVLLVEDNPDLVEAHRDLLESLGSRVTVAGGAEEAAQATVDRAFDLLVVNAYLARSTGLEVLDRVRATRPAQPALLLSGFGDDQELRRRVAAGNLGLLPMPFDREALAAALARAVRQRPVPRAARQRPVERNERREAPLATEARAVRGRDPRVLGAVLAAALMAAVGVGWALRAGRPPALPAPDLAAASRSAVLEVLGPDGELAAPPADFAWREVADAASYRLVMRSVDGTVLWQTETNSSAVRTPAEVMSKLQNAVSYYWRVEALGARGERASRSHLVEFRIHPTVGGSSQPNVEESNNG